MLLQTSDRGLTDPPAYCQIFKEKPQYGSEGSSPSESGSLLLFPGPFPYAGRLPLKEIIAAIPATPGAYSNGNANANWYDSNDPNPAFPRY